jgi:hypothetical protein
MRICESTLASFVMMFDVYVQTSGMSSPSQHIANPKNERHFQCSDVGATHCGHLDFPLDLNFECAAL